jgi:hypothetical protein
VTRNNNVFLRENPSPKTKNRRQSYDQACAGHVSLALMVRPKVQDIHTFFALRKSGGAGRNRTDDLLLAKQALSQLSYSPMISAAQKSIARQCFADARQCFTPKAREGAKSREGMFRANQSRPAILQITYTAQTILKDRW